MRAIDRFDRFSKPLHNGQDQLKNLIFDRYPVLKTDDYCNLDLVYNGNFDSDYVWLVDKNIKIYDSFPWWFKPRAIDDVQIHEFPYVYKESRKVKQWDKVRLVPTKKTDNAPKQHIHICGEYDVYKGNKQFDVFYIGTNQNDIDSLSQKVPHLQTVDTWYQAQSRSYTDMFWVIWEDVNVRDTFKFSYKPDEWSHDYVHVFGNGDIDTLDGVALFPKNYPITEKELQHRFYVNKKEVRIMASEPKTYDKFTINTYKEYENALQKSSTEMFWGMPSDIDIVDDTVFEYYISHHDKTLKEKNHVWLNHNKYNGLVLFSKHSPVTQKEIEYRFISNRIEHKIVASKPKPFEIFGVNSYDDYLNALDKSNTHMFVGIPSDVKLKDNFDIDQYFLDQTELDTGTTHLFLNGEHFDGVALYSKSNKVTAKEIEHRFYSNKKEHDIAASDPLPYEKFVVNNYNDYLNALKETKSDLFWAIPSDVNVKDEFDFNLYFSYHNKFDREINHVFLNGEHYDGIALLSKNSVVTEKEIDHRFYIKKKEWKTVASTPKPYEKFVISSYDDYLRARDQSKTGMFYLIYDDLIVNENFKFDFYITHHNQYERKINHVWKNGEYYDGIALTTKSIMLTKHEIDYRFLAVKKEYDETASFNSPFDIVFISNGEKNADANYQKLLKSYPNAKRVDKVKGIHQAHIEAAKCVDTKMFWVVDGDAEILDDFEFDHQIAYYDIDGYKTVFVWRSLNPVNDLIYGYGGVKLLPTDLTLNMDTSTPDMTTSISKNFKGINRMSNITAFNTDAFSAWRSGFRECVKLASRSIDRQVDDETTFRLKAWCSRGADKLFGEETIAGAYIGAKYGIMNKNSAKALAKINDFEWLRSKYEESFPLKEEINLEFLAKSEEENIKELNPIVSNIFKQIDKKLGADYHYSKGSVKLVIENVGDLYFDKEGVRISKKYADSEIYIDLKNALKTLQLEADTLELYKKGDLVIEGDTDLAQDFFADLKEKALLKSKNNTVNLYCIELSNFIDSAQLNVSINIDGVGIIQINQNGINEATEIFETNINISKKLFSELLKNDFTLIEMLQENSIDYNGDILQVINLDQQIYHQKMNELA